MPALLAIWQVFWGFASSRIGNIVMAALIAFVFGYHKATVKAQREAEAVQAELQKAYWAEIERQRKVAKEIEAKALQRAGEDALISRAMQKKIDEFAAKEKESANVPSPSSFSVSPHRLPPAPRHCVIDDELSRVLQSLDHTAKARRPSHRARNIR